MSWIVRLKRLLNLAIGWGGSPGIRRAVRWSVLLVLLIIYGFWAANVVPGYRYQINPDGVGYIGVAQKYLAGRWADAVNAYWSPLYSWLMVPALALQTPPLLAVKIVDALVGAAALGAAWAIMGHLRTSLETRILATLTLMPIVLYFGMTVITPDLLVAAAVLVYLAHFTRPAWGEDRCSGAITGLLGATCYLAKAYALPFWLGHFVLGSLIIICRNPARRARLAYHTLAALLVLAVVTGAWSWALTRKYGSFTLGSTARFNLAYNGPGYRSPMSVLGFLAPPNPSAVSAWEDATYLPVPTWNPLGTPEEREHFRRNRERNLTALWTHAERFNPHYMLILTASAVLALTLGDPARRSPGAMLVLALVLWPCGYLLLHVEQRFLSLTCLLLLLNGVFALGSVARALSLGRVRRSAAAAVLCWSFLYVPIDSPKPKAPPPALGRWSLSKGWLVGIGVQRTAETVAGLLPARTRVASDERWGEAMYLSFHLDWSYYGVPAPGASADAVLRDLHRHGVQYLLVYGNPARYPWLKGAEDLALGRKAGLRVCRVPTADR